MNDNDEAAWADEARAVQIEDDDPESLAGSEVEFDPEADDPEADEDVDDLQCVRPSDEAEAAGLPREVP